MNIMQVEFENLSSDECRDIHGGAYSILEKLVYGVNYGVAYISEKLSQGMDRYIQNLDDADRNTLYGHYGGARP